MTPAGTHSSTWFVGASYAGRDQTERLTAEGIWENGYKDKLLDVVRAMRPGDRIAIKAAYTRKHGLPFDNRGKPVSVMAIKAAGVITENLEDGRHVRVQWTKSDEGREWYFYTNRQTIWRLTPGDWRADALIDFAFAGAPQDLDRFRNEPYWRDRFGDAAAGKPGFGWTVFYEAVADKLLAFRNRRAELVAEIKAISERAGNASTFQDRYRGGGTGFIRDICPFTTMGIFNRGIADAHRKQLAGELARFLGVTEAVPASFEGVPILNNQKSRFFAWEERQQPGDVDALWKVFADALAFADAEDDDLRGVFASSFDDAMRRRGVGWNLTLGLYWARPWFFPTLDSKSRFYVKSKLAVALGRHGPKNRCSGDDYLGLIDAIEPRFDEPSYPVHSFPELSLAAWQYKDPVVEADDDDDEAAGDEEITASVSEPEVPPAAPIVPYSVADIFAEGCFLDPEEVARALDRLRAKKNLILQGPPGTGKTWLAKRLAFALIGQRDESKVRAVQFHPNLSYEDFVRGWRPSGEGRLTLADGVFLEMVAAAAKAPRSVFVLVIEEINRGNPAQIFGEMLTLLEGSKRTPDEALELAYPRTKGERVSIPDNLHVIGTMNIADRSLALVDLALRRRFAFIDLEPRLGAAWRSWVTTHCGIEDGLATEIEKRVNHLNATIAKDAALGRQFRIGHSYVTPTPPLQPGAGRTWFKEIVATEIGPLLEEYWFDAPEKAADARRALVDGL